MTLSRNLGNLRFKFATSKRRDFVMGGTEDIPDGGELATPDNPSGERQSPTRRHTARVSRTE